MSTFFLAMTLHPEVQRKAREEIDRVVGTYRLPTFSDRESLPYVEAVVKESFRWHRTYINGHQGNSNHVVNTWSLTRPS
jgi:cytochrome P450